MPYSAAAASRTLSLFRVGGAAGGWGPCPSSPISSQPRTAGRYLRRQAGDLLAARPHSARLEGGGSDDRLTPDEIITSLRPAKTRPSANHSPGPGCCLGSESRTGARFYTSTKWTAARGGPCVQRLRTHFPPNRLRPAATTLKNPRGSFAESMRIFRRRCSGRQSPHYRSSDRPASPAGPISFYQSQ